MTPERWQQVAAIFEAAIERPVAERVQFLQQTCNGDSALRREVEAMLAADASANGEFEQMASGLAADWAAQDQHEDFIGRTIGRYQIVEPLGSGGMGEVFLALDTTLDRKVALKLLPRKFTQDRDRLRRFEQEARAASALNHPNIITIHEIGECDGTRFIATEFVEGETLQELAGGKSRDVSTVLEIGCQAASALAAAHDAGIVHRDIKPANIMRRRDGYVKVLDFGLAKLTSARAHLDVTEPGRVMGTINYMSPEQAMGRPLDHRTDIFSLGVVLHELATGKRLFDGQSEAAVYDSILHQPTPSIRDFAPAAPAELDQVLRRALEKDPARRYQSAAEFRADLKCIAEKTGTTTAARIETRERRRRQQSRIFRWAAAACALALLLAGSLLVGKRMAQSPDGSARKAIAVLPFASLDREDSDTYFAEGMHDQLLTDLAKVAELKVIGRTSVLQYEANAARDLRTIGEQLGVSYLLEGSVQRFGGRVRINARLMSANNDEQLWAESYERQLADVFEIQNEIARAIATRLNAKLSASEVAEISRNPTSDLVAFELFARGKRFLESAEAGVDKQEENARTAIDLLTQATQRDPGFVTAFVELGRAHDLLYWTGIERTPERLALGQAAVDAAWRAAPNSGEAHLARAQHFYIQRNFAAAQSELAAARAKMPNDIRTIALSGYMLRRQNFLEESTHELETVMELDPRNAAVLHELAINYFGLHRPDDGKAALQRVIELRPDRIDARLALARLAVGERGDIQPLDDLIASILREDPSRAGSLLQTRLQLAFWKRDLAAIAQGLAELGDDGWYGADWSKYSRQFGEGMLARMKGDHAAAQAHFTAARARRAQLAEEQPDYGPTISVLGLIEAALGRKEEALRAGRRAVEITPLEKDALSAPLLVTNLAAIAAWVGETDMALEILQKQAAERHVNYGTLKLDQFWDPVRNDPRFQQLLASLAPEK